MAKRTVRINLTEEQISQIQKHVDKHQKGTGWGLLGQPRLMHETLDIVYLTPVEMERLYKTFKAKGIFTKEVTET